MNIVLAAHRYLSAQPALTSLLGSSDSFPVWLFQDKSLVPMEGTQSCLLIVTSAGDWAPRSETNTQRFPRLSIIVFADPTRNAAGLIHYDDSRAKMEAVIEQLNLLLHKPSNEIQMWGDVRVLGSKGDGEALYYPVLDGNGVRRVAITYSVLVG